MQQPYLTKYGYLRYKRIWTEIWKEQCNNLPLINFKGCPVCKICDSVTPHFSCVCCPIDFSYLGGLESIDTSCSCKAARYQKWIKCDVLSKDRKKAAKELLEKTVWYTYEEWVALVTDYITYHKKFKRR